MSWRRDVIAYVMAGTGPVTAAKVSDLAAGYALGEGMGEQATFATFTPKTIAAELRAMDCVVRAGTTRNARAGRDVPLWQLREGVVPACPVLPVRTMQLDTAAELWALRKFAAECAVWMENVAKGAAMLAEKRPDSLPDANVARRVTR